LIGAVSNRERKRIRRVLKQLDTASDRDGGNAGSRSRFLPEYRGFQQIQINRNGDLQECCLDVLN